jgi:hypothetical protein
MERRTLRFVLLTPSSVGWIWRVSGLGGHRLQWQQGLPDVLSDFGKLMRNDRVAARHIHQPRKHPSDQAKPSTPGSIQLGASML